MYGTVAQGRRLGAALAVMWCILAGGPALLGAAVPAGAGPGFQDLPREALHEVERGQDLHLIAGYYYGDARQWERIRQANREVLKNPNRLRVGMVLRVPLDRDWKQDLSYADWLKGGGPPPPSGPPAAPRAPGKGPATRPAAAAKKTASAVPAGEPLPPPSGPVTLRYKPAKGSSQTFRLAITIKATREPGGQTQPLELDIGARLREALTLSDRRGPAFPLAEIGLPEPGETLRRTVSPLNKIVRVEGKETDSACHSSGLVYPGAPVSMEGRWQFEETLRVSGGALLAAFVRATEGTGMSGEQGGQSPAEVPAQNLKALTEVHLVTGEEAPAATSGPAAPTTPPAEQPPVPAKEQAVAVPAGGAFAARAHGDR